MGARLADSTPFVPRWVSVFRERLEHRSLSSEPLLPQLCTVWTLRAERSPVKCDHRKPETPEERMSARPSSEARRSASASAAALEAGASRGLMRSAGPTSGAAGRSSCFNCRVALFPHRCQFLGQFVFPCLDRIRQGSPSFAVPSSLVALKPPLSA